MGGIIPELIAFSHEPSTESGVLRTGLARCTEGELVLGECGEVLGSRFHRLTDLFELQATCQFVGIRLCGAFVTVSGERVESLA